MIDAMFPVDLDKEINLDEEPDEDLIECIMLVAIYNSLGASLVDEARKDFDAYIKKICQKMGSDDKPELRATKRKYSISYSFPRT